MMLSGLFLRPLTGGLPGARVSAPIQSGRMLTLSGCADARGGMGCIGRRRDAHVHQAIVAKSAIAGSRLAIASCVVDSLGR